MSDSEGRILPGRVLDAGGAVAKRRHLEELDRARRAVIDAQQEARALLEQARTASAAERERGYAEGLAQARESSAVQTVALRAEAVRLRAEAGDRLIRLAVELAERILRRELRQHPDSIEDLARAALSEVAWCQQITLRLHPDDAQRLTTAQPRLAAALDPGAELRLEADPKLSPGACVVETESGDVDASVEVQLAALERALVGEDHE